jgi:hypothetical protein
MRRAAKIDANQPEIVEGLRKMGVTVQPLHAVGDGCPDLLCGYKGVNILLEIKNRTGRVTAKGKHLTPEQEGFHRLWRGSVDVVWDLGEAINAVQRRSRAD